ncbi:MAG: amidase [Vicinamibacteria bacterium]|nr:amidase [Vicinamibacteria bacterium]
MDTKRASRRGFIGAGVAALAAPALAAAPEAPSPAPQAPPAAATGIDVPTLRTAQTVAGMRQTDEALSKAAPLVTRYRTHIETLRGIDVPTGVEPAFSFNPRRTRPARALPKTNTPPASRGPNLAAKPAPPKAGLDIAFASVSTLRAWLDSGALSSEDLVKLSLDRLQRHDAALSCVVTLADERSLTEAKRADAERRAGSAKGPLHGIPYGAKDLFDSAGIRTLWGARPYRNRPIPTTDATAIGRLKAAGACLTAKLSTGELAIGDAWSGEAQFQNGRPLSGTAEGIKGRKTKNPWDPTTGASGSSAGPAAAVAAGLVPFALGTETGGSIVSPASTCGVVGLRPTYGRVSRHGVMTLRWTLDKAGVIARSVEDSGAVLQAIHGPDGLDGSVTATPFAWTPSGARNARRLRIGVVESELFDVPSTASEKERAAFALTRPVFEAAVEVYRKLGFEIVPVTLPPFPAAALYAIHNAEAGAMFDEITRSGAVDELEGQGPNDRSSQLRASRFIPAVDYIRAQRVRTLMIGALEQLFERIDAFLAPPSSDSVNMTNLTGHPALVLPAGFVKSEAGIEMPQNIMLTGRLDDEATLLDAGLAFERETPWHTKRPPLFAEREGQSGQY